MTEGSREGRLREGTMLSGCRIIEKIGEGGMGCVYRAIDENLERVVAIKAVRLAPGDSNTRERFLREAKVVARLVHPGIAQVYAAGEHEDHLYYIMEFIDGPSLDSFLKKAKLVVSGRYNVEELIQAGYIKRPDPGTPYFLRDLTSSPLESGEHLERVCGLVATVADTLDAVHRSGSVHRDIKPSNIIISRRDEVKLVDFGLVKRDVDPDITRLNNFVGTLNYMAPEQFMGRRGRISPATDVYALGVVFYELATLKRPFEEDDVPSLIAAVTGGNCDDPRELNPRLSSNLSAVIMKCLAKDPAARFASAAELSAAVRDAGSQVPVLSNIKNFFFGLFGSAPRKSEMKAEGDGRGAAETKAGKAQDAHAPKAGGNADATRAESPDPANASKELFEEARAEYFEKFMTGNVLTKLEQSLDLDPGNVESLLFYFLLYNHGVIGRPKFDERWGAAGAKPESLPEKHRMIYEIVAAQAANDIKTSSALGMRYHRLYPDDLLMVVLLCHIEADLGDYQGTLDLCGKVNSRYPDFVITRLFEADIQAGLGNVERCMQILYEADARYPDNSGVRIVAIQNLISYGRLDEADAFIDAVLAKNPDDYVVMGLRPKADLYRGRVREAVNATRKSIGFEDNSLTKAYLYYNLYRIFTEFGSEEKGERQKARDYLAMACKIAPECGFRSFEEVRNYIFSMRLEAMKPENIRPDDFAVALEHAREVCVRIMSPLTYKKYSNLASSTYYHVDEAGNFEKVVTFSNYRFTAEPGVRTQIYLPSAPISPFVNHFGEELESTLRKCQSIFGNFVALVNYGRPQRSGEAIFFMTQLEPGRTEAGPDGTLVLKTSAAPYWDTVHHGIGVSFPAGFSVLRESKAPDRIVERDGRKFYFYTKFLFSGQSFPLEFTLGKN